MIFMRINFKKLNFGQLILMKIIETAGTRQHILKLKCTKLDFGWGLLCGRRSLGLHARRLHGQQIGLPICLFTSGEDGHSRFNHPAVCTLLCTVRCNCGRQCSAAAASTDCMSHSYQISSSESLVATRDREVRGEWRQPTVLQAATLCIASWYCLMLLAD